MAGIADASVRSKYSIQGLNCVDCTQKIQQELDRRGLTDVQINFAAKSVTLGVDNLQIVQSIIKQIEPSARIITSHVHQNDRQNTSPGLGRQLVPIGAAAFLFFTALLTADGLWKTVLYLAAYLLVGARVLAQAGKNILRGDFFDENFLMGVASLGAMAIGQLSEAVGVMLFYAVGEFFQDLAVDRSRDSIRALMDIRPDYAHLETGGQIVTVNPESVEVGASIVVKPGEKVPLDGEVIEGTAFIDTSSLTGESTPRRVVRGDQVLAGTVNTNSVIKVRVNRTYQESSVARIFDLVEDAAVHKAPTEKFITKFSRYYTPAVVLISLGIASLPPLLLPGQTFQQWIYRALTLLVISCPCALVLSIPLGYFGGIGAASKQGILVKGSNYLEALTKLETVVVDKTGTLTKGVFQVKTVQPQSSFTPDRLLYFAALAEAYSAHPIAKSITSAYSAEIDFSRITDYEDQAGFGIKATVDKQQVLVGSERLLNKEGIVLPQEVVKGFATAAQTEEGGATVYVAVGGEYAGFLTIADEIRTDAPKAISGLKEIGIKQIVMLSGDEEKEAARVAKVLEIEKHYAGLLPQDKVARVEELEARLTRGRTLAFVGDGINDAPVLAKAHIGVAMGGLGSDAAIEAADVVIMNDQPAKLVSAVEIAKKTKRIVMQNIVFALGFKFVVLVFGAFGYATMWEAVFADVGVALIAILNSTRTLRS